MIDGWYWLFLLEGTLLICPILWFVVRKSYYGRKLLGIKTRKVHDFYWFWIVFNLSLAVSDYFKHKSIDYIIMDVLFALLGIPFIIISILFLKVEIREEGICSMFGILEWEKIFCYSFFEGKRKGLKIEYEYSKLGKTKTRCLFVENGFLETEKIEEIMERKKIKRRDTIQ